MQTFQDFLESKHQAANPLVEAAMYSLTAELERIAQVLTQAKIPFEVIGGLAVNAHLWAGHQQYNFSTKDVDLLVQRNDLPTIVKAVESAGYQARKIVGGHVLLRPGQQVAEAVHLVFVGEKSRSDNPLPHPPIRAENKQIFGLSIPVAAMNDLVRMKLNSFRPKDVAHLEILDTCELITPQIEKQLPEVLQERLIEARRQIARAQPDVE